MVILKKLSIFQLVLVLVALNLDSSRADGSNLVCYYDATNNARTGQLQLSSVDLELALSFCNHLVYGYAGIDEETFQIKPLDVALDINRNHYNTITALKRKFPHLRILLSVGGDHDVKLDVEETDVSNNKYLRLLEEIGHRQTFVESVRNILRTYGFDGLDLAWQFPKNHPKVIRSGLKKVWHAIKSVFTGAKVVDPKAEEHKIQFTALVRELRGALAPEGFLLTFTLLPNVNTDLFIDVFTVISNLQFVNLATFDFLTPVRDPKVADYPAPLYEPYERDPQHNVNYQVQHWLDLTAPAHKINVGIPAYGRAWVMSKNSGITGYPPVEETLGAASAGNRTLVPDLLSWPEICGRLHANKDLTGYRAPLRKVGDPTNRYGSYAYRTADDNGEYGLWIGYEEPATAATKAGYVRAKGLGGVALFDLTLDDFRGQCAGERFPILRSIKFKL